MENLDIEKLSREMPYKIPENTFEIVQKKVLAKTLHKKQAPIFNLKWVYAAAAVILLLVMANFLITTNDKNVVPQNAKMTAKTEVKPEIIGPQSSVSKSDELAQNNIDSKIENIKLVSDLTPKPISHLKSAKQSLNNVAVAKVKVSPPTEEQIDSVLDGFSSTEIASLSNNSEQDVYLDLYN